MTDTINMIDTINIERETDAFVDPEKMARRTMCILKQSGESWWVQNSRYGYYMGEYREKLKKLQEKYAQESAALADHYNTLWYADSVTPAEDDEEDDVCWEAA